MPRSLRQRSLIVALIAAFAASAGQSVEGGHPDTRSDAEARIARLAVGEEAGSGAIALRLSGPGSLPAVDLFPRRWVWSAMGDGIGSAGLEVRDLDADGSLEIVATAGVEPFSPATYWYVLRWNGSDYEQVWASPRGATPVAAIDVAQADGDSPLEIVVASGGIVQVYEGSSGRIQAAFDSLTSEPRDLDAGDIDADGTMELVLIDANDLFVFDLLTGSLESMRFGFGGDAVAIGQTDLDPALEIAVAAGDLPGSVLDGSTLLVQWGRTGGLGSKIAFGNLDGDPQDELVAGWLVTEGIRAFDLASGAELYHLPFSELTELRIANVDTDPENEVLYGGGQLTGLHAISGRTGVEEWFVRGPVRGVTAVAVGDADADGIDEIFWGAGRSSSGKDVLYAADSRDRVIEWESRDLRGPFRALAAASLGGDGARTLLAGSFASDAWAREGVVLGFDLLRERSVPLTNPVPRYYSTGLWRVRAGNLDFDPQDELCISAAAAQTEGVTCLDGLTQEVAWRAAWPWGVAVVSLAIVDVDGDQQLEVVAGARKSPGGPGLFVYCYRGDTGWLEWRTPDLAGQLGELSLLRVGNVDNDDAPEVVVADYRQRLLVVDGATGLVESGPIPIAVTALELGDLVGDPRDEIYVGLADGTVRRVDAETGSSMLVLPPFGQAIDALVIAPLDEDAVDEFAVSSGGEILVFAGSSGDEIWSSGWVAQGSGERDGLVAEDLDADGRLDLVVDTGVGVAAFLTVPDPDALFADGFEGGDAARWSGVQAGTP